MCNPFRRRRLPSQLARSLVAESPPGVPTEADGHGSMPDSHAPGGTAAAAAAQPLSARERLSGLRLAAPAWPELSRSLPNPTTHGSDPLGGVDRTVTPAQPNGTVFDRLAERQPVRNGLFGYNSQQVAPPLTAGLLPILLVEGTLCVLYMKSLHCAK